MDEDDLFIQVKVLELKAPGIYTVLFNDKSELLYNHDRSLYLIVGGLIPKPFDKWEPGKDSGWYIHRVQEEPLVHGDPSIAHIEMQIVFWDILIADGILRFLWRNPNHPESVQEFVGDILRRLSKVTKVLEDGGDNSVHSVLSLTTNTIVTNALEQADHNVFTSGDQSLNHLLADVEAMQVFYIDYSPTAAMEILNKLPSAYFATMETGSKWGPKAIAAIIGYDPSTVSRYLKAFWRSGIKQITSEGVTIKIPYRPRDRGKPNFP